LLIKHPVTAKPQNGIEKTFALKLNAQINKLESDHDD